jgi:hypothetical protein
LTAQVTVNPDIAASVVRATYLSPRPDQIAEAAQIVEQARTSCGLSPTRPTSTTIALSIEACRIESAGANRVAAGYEGTLVVEGPTIQGVTSNFSKAMTLVWTGSDWRICPVVPVLRSTQSSRVWQCSSVTARGCGADPGPSRLGLRGERGPPVSCRFCGSDSFADPRDPMLPAVPQGFGRPADQAAKGGNIQPAEKESGSASLDIGTPMDVPCPAHTHWEIERWQTRFPWCPESGVKSGCLRAWFPGFSSA